MRHLNCNLRWQTVRGRLRWGFCNGGSVAEAAAWAIVEKSFDALSLGPGDGCEVGPFEEVLSKKAVGVFVRTTLVRTTRLGGVSLRAVSFLREVTTGELAAVVERRGAAMG